MTDAEALQALAAVDRLRVAGAAAAGAIDRLLHQLQTTGGMHTNRARIWLGVNGPVIRWCKVQATTLEHGTDAQQALLAELLEALVLPEPVEADGGELGDAVLRWARR